MTLMMTCAFLLIAVVILTAMTISQQGFLRRAWAREDKWLKLVQEYRAIVEANDRTIAAYKETIQILKG